MRYRRRTLGPWLIAALLVAGFLLTRGSSEEFPSFDGARSARVERVVDGDTVRLAGVGRVRLIGIDTPEVYGHVECFGREASAYAKSVLRRGAEVRYEAGTEAHDRYGRLLAYVWLPDGRLFNRMLVQRGYATTLTIEPNDQLARGFRAAEVAARRARAGMWRRPGCAP
jgi:micrococcal nuclease